MNIYFHPIGSSGGIKKRRKKGCVLLIHIYLIYIYIYIYMTGLKKWKIYIYPYIYKH